MNQPHHFILTKHHRTQIEKHLIDYGQTELRTLSNRIGCHPSTIYRELTRGTDSQGSYRAKYAHKRAVSRVRGRKLGKRKLWQNQVLRDYVHTELKAKWSPDQIAQILKDTYTDTTMHISLEAIYQYIYVLPKGSLKKTLTEGLRQSHKYRRTQRQQTQDAEMRGKIKDMLSIHERPIEVVDRTIPGHWEGDLIIGKYKRIAIATLVERTTRHIILVPLPHGKDAVSVRKAMAAKLKQLPLHLKKTLTYDQGKEMSDHKQFTINTGIQVYFADLASPWQRGTNENTNGLIRQFFPKGTDFSLVTKRELQKAEDLLNGRPRKCIGYKFPKDIFYKLVALDC